MHLDSQAFFHHEISLLLLLLLLLLLQAFLPGSLLLQDEAPDELVQRRVGHGVAKLLKERLGT